MMRHRIVHSVAVISVLAGAPSWAAAPDVPATVPPPRFHTRLICSDGSIRDDELAAAIAACILTFSFGGRVHDIKFMANSCYGGGLLDDIQGICGAGGPLAGTPWVGGAASTWDKPAYGWPDGVVNAPANAGKDLGSTWTDALGGKATSPTDNSKGAMREGSNGNVKRDLERARDKDDSGPNGDNSESPQVASGNGGHAITWTGAASHHAVVFGGDQTDQRHHNNIKNMGEALEGVWAGRPHTVQKIDGGTKADLINAICAAAMLCNPFEQLVIYIDDHGDWELDIDEFLEEVTPWTIRPPFFTVADIPTGYAEGIHLNIAQGDNPQPAIWIDLAQPISDGSPWGVAFNGVILPFPPGPLQQRVSVPVPPSLIRPGPNQIGLVSRQTGAQIVLDGLTLWSGSMNDLEREDPGCQADFNGDGFVDFFDFDAFVSCFEGGSCPPGKNADFNGDGFVDFFDYDDFIAAFEAGC